MARKILAVCCGFVIIMFVLVLTLSVLNIIPAPNLNDDANDPRASIVILLGAMALISVVGLIVIAENETDKEKTETDAKAAVAIIRETPDASNKTVTIERS